MLKQLLPDNIDAEKVEIWSEDETRVGQQGGLTRIWAKKGTRPRKVKQRHLYLHIFMELLVIKQDNHMQLYYHMLIQQP